MEQEVAVGDSKEGSGEVGKKKAAKAASKKSSNKKSLALKSEPKKKSAKKAVDKKPLSAGAAPEGLLSDAELRTALDDLYGGSLEGFIASRKELSGRLKRTGDERHQEVSKLAKPVVSAWVVNILAVRHAALVSELREAGDDVRAVQSGAGKTGPEAHQQVAARRRRAVEAALVAAEAALDDAGQAAARSTLFRVRSSLESLVIYGTAAQPDPPPGRLAQDIEPPGLDVLAQLSLQPGNRGKSKKLGSRAGGGAERSGVLEFRPRDAKAKKPKAQEAKPDDAPKVSAAELRRAKEVLRRAEAASRETSKRLKNAQRSKEGSEKSLQRVRERLVEAEVRLEGASREYLDAEKAHQENGEKISAARDALSKLEP